MTDKEAIVSIYKAFKYMRENDEIKKEGYSGTIELPSGLKLDITYLYKYGRPSMLNVHNGVIRLTTTSGDIGARKTIETIDPGIWNDAYTIHQTIKRRYEVRLFDGKLVRKNRTI